MTKITRQEVIDGWESPQNRREVETTYDEYYNQAIDDAIEKVKFCHENLEYYTTQVAMEPFMQSVVSKLEALKKNQQ